MPREQALAQMRARAAESSQHLYPGEDIILLCRMLFEAPEGGTFRNPIFSSDAFFFGRDANGASISKQVTDYAPEILTLVNDVPFYFSFPTNDGMMGMTGGGRRDSGENYLAYCLSQMRWTTRRYHPASPAILQAAVDQLLASGQWVHAPPEETKSMLAKQISDKPEPVGISLGIETGNFGGGGGGIQPINARGQETVRRDVPYGIFLQMLNGWPPYHYVVKFSTLHEPQIYDGDAFLAGIWLEAAPNTSGPSVQSRGQLSVFAGTRPPPGTTLTIDVTDHFGHAVSATMILLENQAVDFYAPISTSPSSIRPVGP